MKLSPKQLTAVQLLAGGMSGAAICDHLDVNPGTLVRWRKLPDFESHLAGLLTQLGNEATTALRALRGRAVEKIGSLLDCGAAHIEIRAAATILEMTSPVNDPQPKEQSEDPMLAEIDAQLGRAWRGSLGVPPS